MAVRLGLLFLGLLVLGTKALAAEEPLFTTSVGGMDCTVEQLIGTDDARFQVQGVSTDGVWLSYTEEYGKTDDGTPIRTIFLLNLVTGEKVELIDTITNSGAFSPDGRFLVSAFEVDSDRTDIWEIDIETQSLTPIALHGQWDWLPSYSPDGSAILFNSYRIDGQSEIFLYDRESEALRQMTDDPRYDAHAEFSPDGSKILFHRMIAVKDEGGYDFELFVIDVASGDTQQVTPGSPFEESYASWAPDGEHVVFSSDQNGKPEKHNLYILSPDGKIVSRLTKGEWKDSYAFWTKDGKYIYFNSDRSGTANVHRMPMDGLTCVKAKAGLTEAR